MDTIWWILIFVFFLLGYVGLFLPLLPDAPFVLAGFLIYEWLVPGANLGWPFWITVILLTLLLFLVEYIASGIGSKKYGGSIWSMIAAIVGVLLFPLFLGPFGVIVGPFVLVFLLELILKQNWEQALKISFGTIIGFLGGFFVKFLVITGMIIWFFFLVFT